MLSGACNIRVSSVRQSSPHACSHGGRALGVLAKQVTETACPFPTVVYKLDEASKAVGTLSGVGETIPNPHLAALPFLKSEAVLSSRIEGAQASISDVFRFEASGERKAWKERRRSDQLRSRSRAWPQAARSSADQRSADEPDSPGSLDWGPQGRVAAR